MHDNHKVPVSPTASRPRRLSGIVLQRIEQFFWKRSNNSSSGSGQNSPNSFPNSPNMDAFSGMEVPVVVTESAPNAHASWTDSSRTMNSSTLPNSPSSQHLHVSRIWDTSTSSALPSSPTSPNGIYANNNGLSPSPLLGRRRHSITVSDDGTPLYWPASPLTLSRSPSMRMSMSPTLQENSRKVRRRSSTTGFI